MKNFINRLFYQIDNKINIKKIQKVGLFISLCSLIFITNEFKNININYQNFFSNQSTYLSIFFMFISYYAFGKAWSNYLFKNSKVNKFETLMYWLYSNLSKYVPGFIGIPLLRISQDKKIKSKIMFFGLIEEQFIPVITLAPLSFFLLRSNSDYFYLLIVFIVYIVIFFKLLHFFVNFKFKFGKFISYSQSSNYLIVGFILQFFSILLICLEIDSKNFFKLAILYLFSSSLSLLFIGSPSGIGVRELILYTLSNFYFQTNELITLMIYARIIYLISDIFSGIVGYNYVYKNKQQS